MFYSSQGSSREFIFLLPRDSVLVVLQLRLLSNSQPPTSASQELGSRALSPRPVLFLFSWKSKNKTERKREREKEDKTPLLWSPRILKFGKKNLLVNFHICCCSFEVHMQFLKFLETVYCMVNKHRPLLPASPGSTSCGSENFPKSGQWIKNYFQLWGITVPYIFLILFLSDPVLILEAVRNSVLRISKFICPPLKASTAARVVYSEAVTCLYWPSQLLPRILSRSSGLKAAELSSTRD